MVTCFALSSCCTEFGFADELFLEASNFKELEAKVKKMEMEIVFKEIVSSKEKDGQMLCRTLRDTTFRSVYQKHPSAPTTNPNKRSEDVESTQNTERNVMHNVAMIASQSDDQQQQQQQHRLFSKAKENSTRAQGWIEYKILAKDLDLEDSNLYMYPNKLAEIKDFKDDDFKDTRKEKHRDKVLKLLCDALEEVPENCAETRCRKSIKHVMAR